LNKGSSAVPSTIELSSRRAASGCSLRFHGASGSASPPACQGAKRRLKTGCAGSGSSWLRRDKCRSPETPLPWLLEITRNEARRLLGRQARRGSLELFAAAPLEDDALAGAAVRVTIEQAVRTLADGDRRVLHLRYAEDLTQAEVARRLGLPEGTVKVRLHRARGRLRRVLEDEVG
jgi:RNA polymerase sigma-70 factor (ECF subfamily)